VLVLLDCCYAGNAAKGGNREQHAYELITATAPNQVTYGPGKKSFTIALIDSLKELQAEHGGENFSTTKLLHRINRKRGKTQAVLVDQLDRYKRTILLAPLENKPIQEKEKEFEPRDVEKASLNIRFSLRDDNPTEEQIKEFARQLPQACRSAKMPVRRIDWMKMERRRLNFRDAALLATKLVRRRSKESLISPTSKRQATLPSPTSSSEESQSAKRRRTSGADQNRGERMDSGSSLTGVRDS
jgi:hypothetical protein